MSDRVDPCGCPSPHPLPACPRADRGWHAFVDGPRASGERESVGMSAPLLALDNVTKQFVVRRSLLGVPTAVVRAVDGVSLQRGGGRDAGAGRRVGLRQVDGRPPGAAPDRADRGRGPLRRPRPRRPVGRRAAPRPRRRPAHLPGPLRLAQSAHDGGRDAGRAAAAAHRPVAGEPPRARRRAAAHRRSQGASTPSAIRTSSPAASASASPSPARWRWSPS